MARTLRSIVAMPVLIRCEWVIQTEPEDQCMICKELYYPHSPEGCKPLRLLPCNHIIGKQCLDTWITHHPLHCPYWNHPLSVLPMREGFLPWLLRALRITTI
ncbi:hypothetical protein BDV95DRAFT_582308 [Massariosphaeria phaeospora]|uniref:RING-type domain-containing protein n=1 Tax=Massariosphaeria phaeospora TaxID=100035 RepID=A0A7C8M4I6_9PLEO|nr:hypothetical protein BDV95DRAFT_582308 [Massariosphaeria phaeospora]